MSDVSSLFCTPEQGKRLKELVPDLKSAFVWYSPNIDKFQPMPLLNPLITDVDSTVITAPALTLQELNHFARGHDMIKSNHSSTYGNSFELGILVRTKTAPEVAEWVITKLEKWAKDVEYGDQ